MATGKRYYWIKLKDTFMTSDAVDFLMGQPDGANYVVLYQMLCLKTINTGGRLERHIGEVIIPYDEAKIQRDCKWFSIDTVRVALNLYKALGLVYTDRDGALCLTDHENLVGSETDYAEKNRRMRANQQALPSGHNVSSNVSSDVSENVSTEKEIRERDKEIRDKRIENREQIEERDGSSAPVPDAEPAAEKPVISLLLNDGTEFPISQIYIDQMQALFQNVDVKAELRKMAAWLINNPKRRKTRRGVTAFINNWLSSEQDKGRRYPGTKQKTGRSESVDDTDRLMRKMNLEKEG